MKNYKDFVLEIEQIEEMNKPKPQPIMPPKPNKEVEAEKKKAMKDGNVLKKEEVEIDEAVDMSDAKSVAAHLAKKAISLHGISKPNRAAHHAKNADAIEKTIDNVKRSLTPSSLAKAHTEVGSVSTAIRRMNVARKMSSAEKSAHKTLQAGVVKHLEKHLDQHRAAFRNAAAKFAAKNEEVEVSDLDLDKLLEAISSIEEIMLDENFNTLEEDIKNEITSDWQTIKSIIKEYESSGGKYVHKGTYGKSYDHDEEDDDGKPKKPAQPEVKRGRGRPAGSKSGARQIGSTAKKRSGVEYTGFPLHLPNTNK